MSTPVYMDPEQFIRDRAQFARRGVNRGSSVVAVRCAEGPLLVTLTQSHTLRKISEVHDRIAFAGVGKYHEFEALRIAAIRWADERAYQYSRRDVSASSLVNALASYVGTAFISGAKPLEVEILVAEVGAEVKDDHFYVIGFDGSLSDAREPVVTGPMAERIRELLDTSPVGHLGAPEAVDVIAGILREALERSDSGVEAMLIERSREYRACSDVEGVAV